jgi:hypothetical protein
VLTVVVLRYDNAKALEGWDTDWIIPFKKRKLLNTCWVTAENFPGKLWQEFWCRIPEQCKLEFSQNIYCLPQANLVTHEYYKECVLQLWRRRGEGNGYEWLKKLNAPYPTKQSTMPVMPQLMERMAMQMECDMVEERLTDGIHCQVKFSTATANHCIAHAW